MLSMQDKFACSLHKKIYNKHLEIYERRKRDIVCGNVDIRENDVRFYKFEELFYETLYGYRKWNDTDCLIENILPAYNYVHDDDLEEEYLVSNSSVFDNHLQQPILDENYLVETEAWFPIFCGGICRLVCRMPNEKGSRIKIIVSGAILDFNNSDSVMSTYDARYKINQEICKKFLNKYVTVSENTPSLTVSSNYWIRDIVNISRSLRFNFKEKVPTAKMSSKAIERLLIEVLSATKTQDIFDTCKKHVKTDDQVRIKRELANILFSCHIGENWGRSFKSLLQRCGQSSNVIAWVEKTESTFFPKIFEDNDMNLDPVTIETYEEFKVGNIINSTFSAETSSIVMWAVMKDSKTDSFYIRGLVRLQSARNRLCLIEPEIIISVSKNGQSVNTPGHTYELIGPMYTLAVTACYPNSQNVKFLEVFQSYFSAGIPGNWKCIVSIMDILCQCSALEFNSTVASTTAILDFNNSPFYVPSLSVHDPLKENSLSFKIPGSVVSHGTAQTRKNPIDGFLSPNILQGSRTLRVANNSIGKAVAIDTLSMTTMMQSDTNGHKIVDEQSPVPGPNDTVDTAYKLKTAASEGQILTNICESHSSNAMVDLDHEQSKTHGANQCEVSKKDHVSPDIDKPIAVDIFVDLMNSENLDKESSHSVSSGKCKSVSKVLFGTKKKRNRRKKVTFQGFMEAKKQKRVAHIAKMENQLSKKPHIESATLEKLLSTTQSSPLQMKTKEKSLLTTMKKTRVSKKSPKKSVGRTSMKACVTKKSTSMDKAISIEKTYENQSKSFNFVSIEERACLLDSVKTDPSMKKLVIRKILDKPVAVSSNNEYHMVIGRQEVNLSQIVVTRSGRVSLPPGDCLRHIMFEQHGDIVELKKDNKVIAELSLHS